MDGFRWLNLRKDILPSQNSQLFMSAWHVILSSAKNKSAKLMEYLSMKTFELFNVGNSVVGLSGHMLGYHAKVLKKFPLAIG